jgi:hypothetical protein
MTIWTQQTDDSRLDANDFADAPRIERISHRRDGDCPVRSHMSRTRARMRSLASPAARRKSRAFNGAHRRLRTYV